MARYAKSVLKDFEADYFVRFDVTVSKQALSLRNDRRVILERTESSIQLETLKNNRSPYRSILQYTEKRLGESMAYICTTNSNFMSIFSNSCVSVGVKDD